MMRSARVRCWGSIRTGSKGLSVEWRWLCRDERRIQCTYACASFEDDVAWTCRTTPMYDEIDDYYTGVLN